MVQWKTEIKDELSIRHSWAAGQLDCRLKWFIALYDCQCFKDKIIRILPLQVLLNMLEFGMNPQRALDAPRVFMQYDQAGKFLI